jgi:hypothetical protein
MRLRNLTVLLLVASTADASSIGIFADPDYASCNLNIAAPPGIGTLYIAAIDVAQMPYSCGGFTGAEFRVEGLPPGWVTFSTPTPAAAVAVGDPFGAGVNIVFSETLTSYSVPLYTVTIWPATAGAQAILHVTSHSPPSNWTWNCVVGLSGDCPGPTAGCIEGGTLFVNSDTPCTVAVAQSSWAGIKGLFR